MSHRSAPRGIGPAIVLLAAVVACRAERPPSVILVSIDTLRADRLNAYGYRAREVSPQIDRLARDGILFESHISASPWTTPAHMSLFTSLPPSIHGVITSFPELSGRLESDGSYDRLAEQHETLAEVLSRQGYVTAAFTGGVSLDPRIGFDQGFGSYDTSMAKLGEASFGSLTAWIEEHREVPFFVFWHTFEVHAPYTETTFLPEVLDEEAAARLDRALSRVRASPDVVLSATRGGQILHRHRALSGDVCSALYDGGVLSVDGWIGRLRTVLERNGLYEPSLIVVTSDHGEQLGEESGEGGSPERDGRAYNLHGHTLYEEMLRVPLVLKLPGGRHAGRRVTPVSRTIDVMPTVLEVLGLPAETSPGHGSSLVPMWMGGQQSGATAFSEALTVASESKSVRNDGYKYILSFDPEQVGEHGRAAVPAQAARVELYDLKQDPGEKHNLVSNPTAEIEGLVDRLDGDLRRLAAKRAGTTDRVELSPQTLEQLQALGYMP